MISTSTEEQYPQNWGAIAARIVPAKTTAHREKSKVPDAPEGEG